MGEQHSADQGVIRGAKVFAQIGELNSSINSRHMDISPYIVLELPSPEFDSLRRYLTQWMAPDESYWMQTSIKVMGREVRRISIAGAT